MSKIANFENIIFNEHLGNNRGDLPSFGTNFVGDASRLANFNIEHPPVDSGYVLISLWDVGFSHKVELNGVDLFASGNFAYQHGKHKTSNWVLQAIKNGLIMRRDMRQDIKDRLTAF